MAFTARYAYYIASRVDFAEGRCNYEFLFEVCGDFLKGCRVCRDEVEVTIILAKAAISVQEANKPGGSFSRFERNLSGLS